ncbi:aminotransferase class I/II-fold pyridoxal phosphate-dependent enzyme [Halobellus sp. GM3]|uniref:aminotransferase class I/II-fold pyridoxal phosphate-dependent enzyme n=1 Tax=Halobellus sp. GM3 TaxID=3458410 RepID=UPI00403DED19
MASFSERIQSVSPSGIRKVFDSAADDAINLGLGQPDFPTPEHARRRALEAIRNGNADAYTPNKGTHSLRDAIAAKYDRDYGLAVDPDDIIATAGGSEALHLALEAHVSAGEEVIFPDPGFVSYDMLTRVAGGTPKPVGLRDDLTLDPAAVEAALTDETAAFIVNSPANPTGAVQSEADMRAFARIADEHDVLCVSDEVYERIVYQGAHYSPLEFAESDNVVVVSATSKTYSMTGWRLGWVLGSTRRIDEMLKIHQSIQACASAPAQYAAEAALAGPQDPVTEMVDTFEKRRDLVVDGLEDAGLDVTVPEGSFYVMPEVPSGWCDAMLEHGLIVVPGDVFGENGAGYARLSYAAGTEELQDAMEIVRDVTQTVHGSR